MLSSNATVGQNQTESLFLQTLDASLKQALIFFLNPVMSLYLYVLSKAPVYTHLLTWKAGDLSPLRCDGKWKDRSVSCTN